MSHITDVKLKVRDLDALEEAAEACGLELRRGQRTFTWYGRFVGDSPGIAGMDPRDYGKCDHALRLKDHRDGDYEIGVVKAADGDGYDLHVDTWGQHQRLLRNVGGTQQMPRLRQEYAVSQALREARKKLGPKGFVARRETLANGAVLVRLVKR